MSINKVILVGRIGADPVTRTLGQGPSSVTSFGLATSENWKDKQSGERKERTEWHNIQLFGNLGNVAKQILNKGDLVYIEGRIQTDSWTKPGDTEQRYRTVIIGNVMTKLASVGGTKPVMSDDMHKAPQEDLIPKSGNTHDLLPDYQPPQRTSGGANVSVNSTMIDDDIPFKSYPSEHCF